MHLWNPPYCGEIDIRIARDGQWYYLGTPIGRQPLVDLFASILKREDGRYYLVTPVEKVGITVEDAPLFAWDVEAEGAGRDQRLTFTTRTGDVVTAGSDHAIRVVRDSENRRAFALYPRPPRARGEDRPQDFLPSCRTWQSRTP